MLIVAAPNYLGFCARLPSASCFCATCLRLSSPCPVGGFLKSKTVPSAYPAIMKNEGLYKILNLGIAAVWLVNGLFCKVLHLVPRHEQIITRILGPTFAHPLAILIGSAEIVMAIWVLSRYRPRLNALTQIVLVSTMNVIEYLLAPDLLLWGKFNSLFAACFIALVFYQEFALRQKLELQKSHV
mgnify:CR=1 FL=1